MGGGEEIEQSQNRSWRFFLPLNLTWTSELRNATQKPPEDIQDKKIFFTYIWKTRNSQIIP